MKILYYTWNEVTATDCTTALRELGHTVTIISHPVTNYDYDEDFTAYFSQEIAKCNADVLFTFNYFPIISRICMAHHLPYISWVYDSPHFTLHSKALNNPCNHVFIFDRMLCNTLLAKGITTVTHMPLACHRYDTVPSDYRYDVSFVGTLYADQTNFFDQIKGLPDYITGYVDCLINAQQRIYGYDFTSELISGPILDVIREHALINLGPDYEDAADSIIQDMVRKKITVEERFATLYSLSQYFKTDLFSPCRNDRLTKVTFHAPIDYEKEMPAVFAASKINLNITLRSILTGMPLRTLDVLGAGGLLMSNYQEELGENFVDGEDLVLYTGIDDLLDKTDYLLSHEKERLEIAHNGHEKVIRNFSYEVVLERIFRAVFGSGRK